MTRRRNIPIHIIIKDTSVLGISIASKYAATVAISTDLCPLWKYSVLPIFILNFVILCSLEQDAQASSTTITSLPTGSPKTVMSTSVPSYRFSLKQQLQREQAISEQQKQQQQQQQLRYTNLTGPKKSGAIAVQVPGSVSSTTSAVPPQVLRVSIILSFTYMWPPCI